MFFKCSNKKSQIMVKIAVVSLSVISALVFGSLQIKKEMAVCLTADEMDAFRIKEEAHISQLMTKGLVKIAAAQVEVHTGNEINVIVNYINQAGKDKADMIVFGEYLLGSFYKTSEAVQRVSKAAKENNVNVVVGGWEEFEPGAFVNKKKNAFANTALIFNRNGEIVGKYSKTHGAVGGAP